MSSGRVYCAFVFDREILDVLPDRSDRRVEFIWQSIAELSQSLQENGATLLVLHGRASELIPALACELQVDSVIAGRDYEPAATKRDAEVALALQEHGIGFQAVKDHVIFQTDEVLTLSGKPFSVFTPYKNAWLRRLQASDLLPNDAGANAHRRFATVDTSTRARYQLPSLEAIGFHAGGLVSLAIKGGSKAAEALFENFQQRIARYDEARNYPAIKGPSYLSVHLRFGTISIRRLAAFAHQLTVADPASAKGAQVWLSELIWRDFYFQILHHHPQVIEHCFKSAYDRIQWEQRPDWLQCWQQGQTGYPLVDAAMNQLNQTGYMHNRLRMLVASFLTKDLGIDWRLGEAYFANKLIDFDLAANNGGWQWAASTGCDAQPWFRIFNPVTQSERFDPEGKFIRRYLPQLADLGNREIHAPWLVTPARLGQAGVELGSNYPYPVVDHGTARLATLARFNAVKPTE